MKHLPTLDFTIVIKEKVSDYSSSFTEFEDCMYPILRSVPPPDRGVFHHRNQSILIEGNDIQNRANLHAEFGGVTFSDLRHLILKLENLSKLISWCKSNNGNWKWSVPVLSRMIRLGNETVLLTKLLKSFDDSERSRQKRTSVS